MAKTVEYYLEKGFDKAAAEYYAARPPGRSWEWSRTLTSL